MCHHNNNVSLFIEVRELIEEEIENKTVLKSYIPSVYSYQIVAGKNYMVKVSECFCLYFLWILITLPNIH